MYKSCGTGSHVSKADFDFLQFHMCQQINSLELDGGKKNGCACELDLLLFTGSTIILVSNANWQPPTCFENTVGAKPEGDLHPIIVKPCPCRVETLKNLMNF